MQVGQRSASAMRTARSTTWRACAATVIICSNVVERIEPTAYLSNMFALDAFAIFFKLLFIGAIALQSGRYA